MNYTQFNENSLHQFKNEDDIYEAIDFLKDPSNFRNFDEGLVELMHRKGYSTELNVFELSGILYSELQNIGSSISRTTIGSWFQGTHRPKIEAGYRKQIYEICFALKLNCDETKWFFQHVYYDRAFNCHTITESVYFFSFLNNLPYTEAQEIINIIESAPSPSILSPVKNYTQFSRSQIESFHSKDELIRFLTYHKSNYESWNQSSFAEIQNRMNELIPTDLGKKEISNVKRTITRKNTIVGVIPKQSCQKEWGLIMQEFFSSVICPEDLEYISGLNIQSNAFILKRILSPSSCEVKIDKTSVPYIVKNNFPTRKTMSDILSAEKISHSKSYDSIRKVIILLNFYIFWVRVDLGYTNYLQEEQDCPDNILYDAFIKEMDATLYNCGYEYLYAGNPYDWLFMCAAQTEKPLRYFRDCMIEIQSEDED